MCKELGLQYAEWSALPKTERARWIAYHELQAEIDEYTMHRHELKRLRVNVEDWLSYDEKTREMKLAHAESLRKSDAHS